MNNSIDINITSPKVDFNLEVATAQEAKDKASEAATSATNAANSATNAAVSETNAFNSATSAADSETAAKASETAAKASETAAKDSETAAKASETAAKTSETNAKTSESNAAASKSAAATSASAAKTSEQNAGTQANTAKAWATSTTSPDGAADTASTTGKTQSAKSWAMYSKDRATASASSASAAATSASAAKTSETNAASSKSAAATSATNAANSANAAADSATAAANSAKEQQADWNVTDSTSKAFIKNKPEVLLKSGGTATGAIIAPSFQTGNDASHYFQCRQFRGEGNAATYYHAVDFGYAGHNQVDFYEYGGVWNFHKCQSGQAGTSTLVGSIRAGYGWYGLVKGQDITTYAKKSDLSSSVSTKALTVTGETSVPTANEGNSSNTIANTEFVAKSLAAAAVELGVLPGTVTAFSGTFKDGYPVDKNTGLVNKEWHLCDGTNGTPDLRNRFIYGGDGTNNGATGGEAMPPYYTLAFIMKL